MPILDGNEDYGECFKSHIGASKCAHHIVRKYVTRILLHEFTLFPLDYLYRRAFAVLSITLHFCVVIIIIDINHFNPLYNNIVTFSTLAYSCTIIIIIIIRYRGIIPTAE